MITLMEVHQGTSIHPTYLGLHTSPANHWYGDPLVSKLACQELQEELTLEFQFLTTHCMHQMAFAKLMPTVKVGPCPTVILLPFPGNRQCQGAR